MFDNINSAKKGDGISTLMVPNLRRQFVKDDIILNLTDNEYCKGGGGSVKDKQFRHLYSYLLSVYKAF